MLFKKILEYRRKANMHLFMKTITKFPLQGQGVAMKIS
jgi:hypothetical protein